MHLAPVVVPIYLMGAPVLHRKGIGFNKDRGNHPDLSWQVATDFAVFNNVMNFMIILYIHNLLCPTSLNHTCICAYNFFNPISPLRMGMLAEITR